MNCAWCGANDDHSDSHGICQSCADELVRQAEELKLQRAQEKYNSTPSYVEVQAALFAQECDALLDEQMEVCSG